MTGTMRTGTPESTDWADVGGDDPSETGTDDVAADQPGGAEPDESTSGFDGAGADETDETEADETEADETEAETQPKSSRRRRSISISLRSLVIGMMITVLIGAAGTFAWLYLGAESRLDEQAALSASDSRAEKAALDYAVNAATMDYKDLQAWKVKLVAGTSPELNKKLSEAATSMEQIMVPLEWSSTAEPLVAKVRSRNDGLIVVDCFVAVQTKTVQAPEALQSTATYSITIDSNNNWLITDVGGIGSVVAPN